MLQKAADDYLNGVKTGKLLVERVDDFRYNENFENAAINTGYHTYGINISLYHHLLDTVDCATKTEMVAHENKPPYVAITQMRLNSAGKVNFIDSLVITTGKGWVFDAKETYRWASKETRGEIPEPKRDTRAVIKAAADAYLDKFTDPNIIVPHADPCERLEGRAHISPNCIAGIKSSAERKMGNRRYVIDEVVGTVDVFLTFEANPDYQPNPDSHEFRVEAGKIRYVHTNSVGQVPPPKYGGIKGIGT
ncbi:hypothetical protein BT63DRAFT_433429 [Microthyrium microscopicum]|uniref:DUF8021 domain-containing protein n=1 Tax=Microthyrium microscopicum TaxID=703497 RepID=A0A6A6U733_9PEZI|nr:hypothetical protein BT63DRAFT_433429 [Microthyrium microscopicum]